MITQAFDSRSPAIINPRVDLDAPTVNACILTFSDVIEQFVLAHYDCEQIGAMRSATGETPVYRIDYRGGQYAFFKTMIGAPACVGTIEDSYAVIRTKRYVLFGGAGCLNKEIARGRIMVPTAAAATRARPTTTHRRRIISTFQTQRRLLASWRQTGCPL